MQDTVRRGDVSPTFLLISLFSYERHGSAYIFVCHRP